MNSRERELIDIMVSSVPHEPSPVGPGDDAAVRVSPPGTDAVLTADAMVEGVHFVRAHPPSWLGWKLLMVNLSDVAAMGARPDGFLIVASLPQDIPTGWWTALARGIGQCARATGARLAGGDVTASPGPLALSVTAWGTIPSGRPALCRSGGRPGDLLMVSGSLGRSALGMARWLSSPRRDGWPDDLEPDVDPAVRAHLRPEPHLELGPWALEAGAHAGMDLSDGLAADSHRLARASEVRLVVDLLGLPEDPVVSSLSPEERVAGGEDYGLAVLIGLDDRQPFEAEGFRAIGRAEAGDPGVTFVRGGQVVELPAGAFEHFG